MPSQETGKTRAQRIQLDYHQQPDPLNRSRWLCVLAAMVAAGAYAVYAMMPVGATHVSPGSLSISHAAFENDCAQCHGDGWRLFSEASDDWQIACQECHPVAGHFRSRLTSEKQAAERNCRFCHRDHQGRMHNLVHLTDSACQQCHRQLAHAVSKQPPTVRPEIQRFSLDSHGDFRSLEIDLGEIQFNHQLHLQPGQVPAGSRGGFRLSALAARWLESYRKEGQGDNALVELHCDDCHEPDSRHEMAVSNAADHELGRYYAPINFDRHCAACHSLNYVGQSDDLLPLPHAVPWSELEIILTSKLVGGRMTGRIRAPGDAARKEPLPGTGSVSSPKPSADLTDLQMRRTMLSIRNRCRQCHREEHLSDQAIEDARAERSKPLIPSRWLRYGYYDHAAHPGIRCLFCHDTAETASVPDHERVMIGGIESCTPCHRPADMGTPESLDGHPHLLSQQTTWASDRCTLCHRYHWTRPERATSEEAQP